MSGVSVMEPVPATPAPNGPPAPTFSVAPAGSPDDTTTAVAISLLTRQMAEFDTRLGGIETLLKSRKQWIAYAGWIVAAVGGTLAHGGDPASMIHTFVELLGAGSP